jgi:hypothetical protein
MIERQLLPEVETLFPVWPAGRQLATHREIAAPRASSPRHRNPHLLPLGLREELTAERLQALAQCLVDTVTDDIEESTFAAGRSNLLRDLNAFRCVIHERSDVDHGDVRELTETHLDERCIAFSGESSPAAGV